MIVFVLSDLGLFTDSLSTNKIYVWIETSWWILLLLCGISYICTVSVALYKAQHINANWKQRWLIVFCLCTFYLTFDMGLSSRQYPLWNISLIWSSHALALSYSCSIDFCSSPGSSARQVILPNPSAAALRLFFISGQGTWVTGSDWTELC